MTIKPSSIAALLLTLLAACDEPTQSPKPAATVNIAADTVWVAESVPAQLVAEARDADGELVADRPTTWTMRVLPIAGSTPFAADPVLDERGMVQARGFATAVVTVTVDGARDSVVVVTEPRPEGVFTNIHASRLEVAVGARLLVKGEGRLHGTFISPGRWSSSDPQVIQFDTASPYPYSDFKLKLVARKAGTARVDYTLGGVTKSVEFVVREVNLVSNDTRGRCGLAADGSAWCQGGNGTGQVGTTTFTVCTKYCFQEGANVRFRAAGGLTFTSLVSGSAHSCALTADGTSYCWGRNQEGQLGTAAADADCAIGPNPVYDPYGGGVYQIPCSFAPVAVQGGLKFRSLEALEVATCGVATDGRRYCWGSGYGNAPKDQ